jgi:hypothetical protein
MCVSTARPVPLGVNIRVPHHACGDERIGHSSSREDDVGKAFVPEVRLANVHTVTPLGERPATVIAESHVCGARVCVRFQPDAKEPVIGQRPAQSQTQAIALAIALESIAIERLALANFIAHARVAIQLEFRDRSGKFDLRRIRSRAFRL